MGGILDYVAPGRKKNSKEKNEISRPVELKTSPSHSPPNSPPWMTETPTLPSPQSFPPQYSHAASLTPSAVPSQVGTPNNGLSRSASRAGSIYPTGDFRNAGADEINDIKCEVMVSYLHSQQEEKLWTAGEPEEGVMLKKSRGQYTCAPADLADEPAGFFAAVRTLNVKVS